ncbi:hypothetical protein BSKO_02786 [Bryopsis sp. KO-2023]|nr:hypothetical protein BSKO_02786 [Bryopsis sp. KO-2023]
MSDLVSVTLRPSTVEWDLPEGVLCQIFDLLPIKPLGRWCSVKKSWSDLISENHDLKLERAWRTGEIEPKRSNFDLSNQTIYRSAKHDRNGVLCFVDGVLLSGAQELGVVRVWDVPELVEKASFKIPQRVVDVADVGEHVAVCGSYGYLGFWKKEDWSESQVLQIGDEITSFTYFEGFLYFGLVGGLGIGHSKFACQSSTDRIELWDIDEDRCFRTIYFNDCLVIGMYLTIDRLVVVKREGEVLQFDFASIDK